MPSPARTSQNWAKKKFKSLKSWAQAPWDDRDWIPRTVAASEGVAKWIKPYLVICLVVNLFSGLLRDGSPLSVQRSSFWLTRIVFLRFLNFIYAVAFLVAFQQNKGLIGDTGLTPARDQMDDLHSALGGDSRKCFLQMPSVLWFVPQIEVKWRAFQKRLKEKLKRSGSGKSEDSAREEEAEGDEDRPSNSSSLFSVEEEEEEPVPFSAIRLDPWLDGLAQVGLGLSLLNLLFGSATFLGMAVLWGLYFSIVSVGQTWYSFGWESQLLETGILAAFLCPFSPFNWSSLPRCGPPLVCVWGFRFLIFRIMLGAGLIKVRGDDCWRELTCMDYHYQTQPVPNPFSHLFHFNSKKFHKVETATNHFVELLAPFMLVLAVRPLRLVGGLIQIIFQVVLILSGNLSFLNWLTIVPSIFCLDDAFLSPLFSAKTVGRAAALAETAHHARRSFLVDAVSAAAGFVGWDNSLFLSSPGGVGGLLEPVWMAARSLVLCAVALLLSRLSLPVLENLKSPGQAMNRSFGPWRLVNTYGAFGSVTKRRFEVVLQGTRSSDWRETKDEDWIEYQFNVKPGDLFRRPPWISPYHFRLDWLMWFCGFGSPQRHPWVYHLIARLLVNDPQASSLLRHNPFLNGSPPRWIRARLYEYRYALPGSEERRRGQHWVRRPVDDFVRPISVSDSLLMDIMLRSGWWRTTAEWINLARRALRGRGVMGQVGSAMSGLRQKMTDRLQRNSTVQGIQKIEKNVKKKKR
uniref:Lipase maturation factor n=1 Tax=Chromera velia CCMP2878 TaxID=1169474 RepID=A0A0G4GRG8_9ALVE|eukprot:Cvel_23066.t1-p1 / transcript=Cvel_23066.t1 / gene=Cvel_23066 / organism=Chromera_velia_CCMP2878 / gene_product=Lipase maturation factor 1, putative / transcript_product=Lipase maturation factor 1, putative / location=Cvel_scaffold2335:6727-12635(-) / protein_length=742 / sequence_SO=supercontig / SO=protein_coding / is_pseudo=false